jgi:hypothetical protein
MEEVEESDDGTIAAIIKSRMTDDLQTYSHRTLHTYQGFCCGKIILEHVVVQKMGEDGPHGK